MAKTGVLLVAFGGPDSLDSVEPFMRNLMGREPSPEAIQTCWRKYLTIGGASPLPGIAERIAAALERRLSGLPEAAAPEEPTEGFGGLAMPSMRATEGVKVPVVVGMLHWRPLIGQAVQALAASGVERVVWTSLSPFESSVTSGAYRAEVAAACEAAGVRAVEGDPYHDSPVFVALLADACTAAMEGLFPEYKPAVVFTAHSMPVDELGEDPYVAQLEQLASQVARQVGLGEPDAAGLDGALGIRAHGGLGKAAPWLLAYQSKGARPGAWLDPTIDDVIEAAQERHIDSLAVCPIGFATDHLETLWDLDVDAADKVLSRDMEFARAKAPNDDPVFIGILADAVSRHL
jgi:ferrochelatase